MRMGIVTQRRRKRRAAQLRRAVIRLAFAAGVLAALAFSPAIRRMITDGKIQAFSQSAEVEMTLPEYSVYALQLAVFDSGERAGNALKRLQSQGVLCVVWQKERMRIVADAAFERGALNADAAKGNEAYVIQDTLEEVSLRLSADAVSVAQAKALLETPDALLKKILQESAISMAEIAAQAGEIADEALRLNTGHTLYAQLAQNLQSWRLLMETTLETADEAQARSYGAVTMYALCSQLRQALRALSTASAQRTPSTAADVMPPA